MVTVLPSGCAMRTGVGFAGMASILQAHHSMMIKKKFLISLVCII